jgi:hypothetical protein
VAALLINVTNIITEWIIDAISTFERPNNKNQETFSNLVKKFGFEFINSVSIFKLNEFFEK